MTNSNQVIDVTTTPETKETTVMNTDTQNTETKTTTVESETATMNTETKNTTAEAKESLWTRIKAKFASLNKWLRANKYVSKFMDIAGTLLKRTVGHTLAWASAPATALFAGFVAYKAKKGLELEDVMNTKVILTFTGLSILSMIGTAVLTVACPTAGLVLAGVAATSVVAHYAYDAYKWFKNRPKKDEKKA